jgi:cytochrome c2
MLLGAGGMLWAQGPAKKSAPPESSARTAGEREAGRKVYEAKCAVCHYDKSAAKKIGPGLAGLSKRGKYADGKPVDDETLRAWIEKGGKNMPGHKAALKPEQVRELIAYLKTL